MSKCRSCGTSVEWIKTKQGKMMPVNPREINIVPCNGEIIGVTDDGEIIKGVEVNDSCEDGYYIARESHFATCPEAEKWRIKH